MKAIGGYFELELATAEEYHKNAIRLNTGRNAFEYILKAKAYKKVYLPFYTCDVMLEPIKKLNISYEFYSIQNTFEPIFDFYKVLLNEVFVYTNYFGICNHIVKEVSEQCENLIIDNSQAFFSIPLPDVDTFYSARKFFGIADGAYLYTNKQLNENLEIDISYQRFEHLLGRIDIGAEAFYNQFKRNDDLLKNQPIKQMSNLTRTLLSTINYQNVYNKRQNNFLFLHSYLKSVNELDLNIDLDSSAMIYPFLIKNGNKIKNYLIKNKVFVATYWPEVCKFLDANGLEMYLCENLICIPIDQRYDENDMERIINLILKYE